MECWTCVGKKSGSDEPPNTQLYVNYSKAYKSHIGYKVSMNCLGIIGVDFLNIREYNGEKKKL